MTPTRPYLDTVRTSAGELDETLCLTCSNVLYSPVADRAQPVTICPWCRMPNPVPDSRPTQYAYAALAWFPDARKPVDAFGRVRAYVNEQSDPTVEFLGYRGVNDVLPLLTVVWDRGAQALAYTVRGWDASLLPAAIQSYLTAHPDYGTPQTEAARYQRYVEPAWPVYGKDAVAT